METEGESLARHTRTALSDNLFGCIPHHDARVPQPLPALSPVLRSSYHAIDELNDFHLDRMGRIRSACATRVASAPLPGLSGVAAGPQFLRTLPGIGLGAGVGLGLGTRGALGGFGLPPDPDEILAAHEAEMQRLRLQPAVSHPLDARVVRHDEELKRLEMQLSRMHEQLDAEVSTMDLQDVHKVLDCTALQEAERHSKKSLAVLQDTVEELKREVRGAEREKERRRRRNAEKALRAKRRRRELREREQRQRETEAALVRQHAAAVAVEEARNEQLEAEQREREAQLSQLREVMEALRGDLAEAEGSNRELEEEAQHKIQLASRRWEVEMEGYRHKMSSLVEDLAHAREELQRTATLGQQRRAEAERRHSAEVQSLQGVMEAIRQHLNESPATEPAAERGRRVDSPQRANSGTHHRKDAEHNSEGRRRRSRRQMDSSPRSRSSTATHKPSSKTQAPALPQVPQPSLPPLALPPVRLPLPGPADPSMGPADPRPSTISVGISPGASLERLKLLAVEPLSTQRAVSPPPPSLPPTRNRLLGSGGVDGREQWARDVARHARVFKVPPVAPVEVLRESCAAPAEKQPQPTETAPMKDVVQSVEALRLQVEAAERCDTIPTRESCGASSAALLSQDNVASSTLLAQLQELLPALALEPEVLPAPLPAPAPPPELVPAVSMETAPGKSVDDMQLVLGEMAALRQSIGAYRESNEENFRAAQMAFEAVKDTKQLVGHPRQAIPRSAPQSFLPPSAPASLAATGSDTLRRTMASSGSATVELPSSSFVIQRQHGPTSSASSIDRPRLRGGAPGPVPGPPTTPPPPPPPPPVVMQRREDVVQRVESSCLHQLPEP